MPSLFAKPKRPSVMADQGNPTTVSAENSTIGKWDFVGAIILMWTAVGTPYEIAFENPPKSSNDALFIANRIIDIYFLCDMALQFFIRVPRPPPPIKVIIQDDDAILKHKEDTEEVEQEIEQACPTSDLPYAPKGVRLISHQRACQQRKLSMRSPYIDDHRGIAVAYFKSWFLVDLLSVSTSSVDIILVASSADGNTTPAGGSSSNINQVRVLRVFRTLRLMKLVRLVKSSRMLNRWKTKITLSFGMQTIIKSIAVYLLMAHWMACVLMIATEFTDDDSPMNSWLGSYGYCVQRSNGSTSLPWGYKWSLRVAATPSAPAVYCVSSTEQWLATYYWMIMLISGAAGGDVKGNVFTTEEQTIFTFLVIMAAFVNAIVIAAFCDVFTNTEPEIIEFRQLMDRLNKYCKQKNLDSAIRTRLREYLYRYEPVIISNAQRELIKDMSPKLQGELELQVNSMWLMTVRFLVGVEVNCCMRIAKAIATSVKVPAELLPADMLYYCIRGTLIYEGSPVTSGQMWGTDCILSRPSLRSSPARALTFVEVASILRSDLLEITFMTKGEGDDYVFPIAQKRVRGEAIRLAIIRMLRKLSLIAVKRQEAPGRSGADFLDQFSQEKHTELSVRRAALLKVDLPPDVFQTGAGAGQSSPFMFGASPSVSDGAASSGLLSRMAAMEGAISDVKTEMRALAASSQSEWASLHADMSKVLTLLSNSPPFGPSEQHVDV